MLYLASDSELPPCPDSTWEGGATFFVRALIAEEEHLYRDLLSKRYVAYLGSSDGCGCAFHYCPDEDVFSPDGMPPDVFEWCVADRTRRLDGLSRLHAFIHAAARSSDLELLVTWASVRPESITRRSVTVDHFATYERGLDLPEKCLFEIARIAGDAARPG